MIGPKHNVLRTHDEHFIRVIIGWCFPGGEGRGRSSVSIVSDLVTRPGVVAAGEYAYRGDRFAYKGDLSEEWARMASIMCRATTMSASMQGRMLDGVSFKPSGIAPVRGWFVRGPRFSVCVVANVFCMIENDTASLNAIVAELKRALADAPADLV